jgi:hypothetical protein
VGAGLERRVVVDGEPASIGCLRKLTSTSSPLMTRVVCTFSNGFSVFFRWYSRIASSSASMYLAM